MTLTHLDLDRIEGAAAFKQVADAAYAGGYVAAMADAVKIIADHPGASQMRLCLMLQEKANEPPRSPEPTALQRKTP